ncbi:MAG TPA: lasso peptide biosynthesis B2 protein [Gemmatimonadaceae bacterium]|nr:lasso peptide biosynthesis B2 protein [Gemmatimonadaceae bacterium]
MALSPLAKLLRLPPAERRLLIRSLRLVAQARLALWLLPFNVARRWLARSARKASRLDTSVERIGWAISVAKDFVPRANCLPQGLAAESLLIRGGHPVELRIGVVKDARGRLEAHMWVESSGTLVVGDLTQGLSTYTPLPPLPGVRH